MSSSIHRNAHGEVCIYRVSLVSATVAENECNELNASDKFCWRVAAPIMDMLSKVLPSNGQQGLNNLPKLRILLWSSLFIIVSQDLERK